MKSAELARALAVVVCTLAAGNVASQPSSAVPSSQVTYPPSLANIANPERGWFFPAETRSSAHIPLDDLDLDEELAGEDTPAWRQNITLIHRMFYLDTFQDSEISDEYLDLIRADFAHLRELGLKAVVRFAYSSDAAAGQRDATEARIVSHIGQLASVLEEYSDVIAVMQAGFIGAWGEWYYSDFFSDPGSNAVSQAQYRDRGDVLASVLAAIPGRFVQLRTPLFKEQLAAADYGTDPAPDMSRVGHVNDCFLASKTDQGTYINVVQVNDPQLNEEYRYLMQETRTYPMGGETCAVSTRSTCQQALRQLDDLHWSYLNSGYNTDVLNSWSDECKQTIAHRLGYRLSLLHGSYERAVTTTGGFGFRIQLTNTGWAAPFNARGVELVLRNVDAEGQTLRRSLSDAGINVDPRQWFKAEEVASHRVDGRLPMGDVPPGVYQVLLNLPDPAPLLSGNPSYSIQLANTGVWETETGYNDLHHQVSVSDADGRLQVASAIGDRVESVDYVASASVSFLPGFDSRGKSLVVSLFD